MLRISPLPLHRIKTTPIAVLNSDGTIEGESSPKLIYCSTAIPALRLAKEQGGKALIIRTRGSTRWVRFQVGETEIIPGVACAEIEQLIAFRDYCKSVGVQAASLQAMGFNLMRYSLAGYFDVDQGGEIPFRLFPPGARVHAQKGIWSNVTQVDLTAAYLWGIGNFSPAQSFSEYRRIRHTEIQPGSWALIRTRGGGDETHGHIPEISGGVTVFPTKRNEWSPRILVSSYDLLCADKNTEVRIEKVWIPSTITRPFSPFMHLIGELRETHFRGVAKQAGNTLWGSFSSQGKSAIIEFTPGGKNKVYPLPSRDPLCLPIGSSVLAMVRSRLYTDGMNNLTFPSVVFHAHTDGFITKTRALKENLLGNGIGEWRKIADYEKVEILGGNWYSTSRAGHTRYKLAGRNSTGPAAERLFRHHRERVLHDG